MLSRYKVLLIYKLTIIRMQSSALMQSDGHAHVTLCTHARAHTCVMASSVTHTHETMHKYMQ